MSELFEVVDRDAIITEREHLALLLAVQAYTAGRERRILTARDEHAFYWKTLTAFWAEVNRLIDDPRLIAHSPVTCRILRERRDRRNTERGH